MLCFYDKHRRYFEVSHRNGFTEVLIQQGKKKTRHRLSLKYGLFEVMEKVHAGKLFNVKGAN